MNEHDLMEALEDHAGDVLVGPAPIDVMTRSAGRTRRRRGALGGLAAAAAVAVVTGGLVQVLPGDGDDRGRDRVVQPADADVPPAGSTYVGLGRAAIAVPSDWARDDVECNGVPKHDTWTVNLDLVVCGMASPFPADTDIVTLSGEPFDVTGWTPVEIDGAGALRSPDEEATQAPDLGDATIFGASVFLPDEGVTFRVQSTVSKSDVDALLAGIVLLDEHVGVPGVADVGSGDMTGRYLRRLEELGLAADVVDAPRGSNLPSGTIAAVEPEPGTLVEPGATVRVTAVP